MATTKAKEPVDAGKPAAVAKPAAAAKPGSKPEGGKKIAGLSRAARVRTGRPLKKKRQPVDLTPGSKLPAVPEVVLKRRKARIAAKANLLRARAAIKAKNTLRRRVIFKRAEQYQWEYLKAEQNEKRLKRSVEKNGDFYVPPEAKLAFIVRIKGINKLAPKVRKVLQLFRLLQINNGVFVKLNKATLNMIRIIDPYIAWGYPNLKTIRDLIYKRGFVKVQNRRMPIHDNVVIEKNLKHKNILCVEDIVHEIFTVGPKFKYASNFLWPFKLNTPTGGWKRKSVHYVNGGDFGNREGKINELVRRMI